MKQRHPYAKEITAWATGSDDIEFRFSGPKAGSVARRITRGPKEHSWQALEGLSAGHLFSNPELEFRISPVIPNICYRLSLHGWSDESNYWVECIGKRESVSLIEENDDTFIRWLTEWTEVAV